MAALENEHYDEAILDFSRAIELNPTNPNSYDQRGTAYRRKGLLDKAISDYNKAIELDPDFAPFYYDRAVTELGKFRSESVISDCTKAIQLDPTYANAYMYRGGAYLSKGLYDEAITDFSKAIDLDPKWDQAYVNRGAAYTEKRQYDQAISDFDQAVRINPENAMARKDRDLVLKMKTESGSKMTADSKSQQTTGQDHGDTMDQIIKDSVDHSVKTSGETGNKATGESKSQQTNPQDLGSTMDQIIKDSVDRVTKDSKGAGGGADLPQSNETATPHVKAWCEALLKAAMSNLPQGYSHPQISSTELTAEERAAGVICKISVNLQGPDPFDAMRFRIFSSVAAAERGLKSLPKLVPDISVFESQPQIHGRDTPCMVYTSGNRTLQFISCADQVKGTPIVVSGVSSERYRDSYSSDTVLKAAGLLEAAERHCASVTVDHTGDRIAQSNDKTTSASQLQPWQTSVQQFVREVQRLYSNVGDRNAREREITKQFNGKEVHWEGRVIKTGEAVIVRLGDYSVTLPDGKVVTVDDVELFGPNFAPSADTVIRFRVTLVREDKAFPFPAVLVGDKINEQDHSTRTVIEISAEHDAALE
jgi:lipoprotein NlpI